VGEVFLLPFAPGRLGDDLGVGALVHDIDDPLPEAAADFLPGRISSPVLDDIVQKGRDGRVLVTAVFEDDRGDGHQVSNVGDLRPLPELLAMRLVGVGQRFIKPRRQKHSISL